MSQPEYRYLTFSVPVPMEVTVDLVGRSLVHVKLDVSGRNRRFNPRNLRLVGLAPTPDYWEKE